jgi:hypothetical protein
MGARPLAGRRDDYFRHYNQEMAHLAREWFKPPRIWNQASWQNEGKLTENELSN